jgi:hypothetical protein
MYEVARAKANEEEVAGGRRRRRPPPATTGVVRNWTNFVQ